MSKTVNGHVGAVDSVGVVPTRGGLAGSWNYPRVGAMTMEERWQRLPGWKLKQGERE
jgi:hypothetical protein